jgi:60 kDa SS-A/Ro ribonucleoprotein
MANQSLFNTRTAQTPKTDTTNRAGGVAYQMGDKEALAQLAATGCLSNTFYANAKDQLDEVLALAAKCEPEFVAKTAVYARSEGLMKDMPALLASTLAVRDPVLFEKVAPRCIDNGRMIRNLVQMLRSGAVGEVKNLPRPVRRFIRNWVVGRNFGRLFNESVGNDPSMADVIKMVHPKPTTPEQAAFFGYLLSRDHDAAKLPEVVRKYEAFKADKTAEVPRVEFRMLDSLGLSTSQWADVAQGMGWHAIRMNLNTLLRHGVFKDPKMVKYVCDRLVDEEAIRKSRVFPYQLLTAYRNVNDELPMKIRMALQDALELAVENVPVIDGKVIVAPDVSGSMGSSVTGYQSNGRPPSKTSCVDVAALVAAAILRKNPDAEVIPFAHRLYDLKLNPRDSIVTNADKLIRCGGGGTACALPLALLNKRRQKADVVIYVSDNQSWMESHGWGYQGSMWDTGGATASQDEWTTFKRHNPGAKLILNDVQPYTNSQAKESKDVYNVGGFSDAVFKFIAVVAGAKGETAHWSDLINKVSLEAN